MPAWLDQLRESSADVVERGGLLFGRGPAAAGAAPVVLREIARVGAGRFVAFAEEDDAQGLDLGLVALVPRILVLPAPRPELALDEDEAALGEVLLAELGQLAVDHDVVPLRPVGRLAGIRVEQALVRGQGEAGFPAILLGHAEHLGLLAETADEDDLVQAVDVSHFSFSSRILSWAMRASSSSGYLATRSLSAASASGFLPSSMKLRPFLR